MVKMKSRSASPPGGWMFFEPQTGKHFTGWGFEAMVSEIQSHRLANPRFNLATDLDSIRVELDSTNALRVAGIPGAEGFLDNDGDPPASPMSPRHGKSGLRAVAGGSIAMANWGISGEVVGKELAEKRAQTCVKCPKNVKGDWTNFFTEAAASLVKKELEIRNTRKLFTSVDDQLHICEACFCPLKIKVHCPPKIIENHITSEAREALWSDCWITAEGKAAA